MTQPMTDEPWTAFKIGSDQASWWWVDGPQWIGLDDEDIFMTEYDARLIAAAPDLLRALEKAVVLFAGDDGNRLPGTAPHAWLHEARAALARVQGQGMKPRPSAVPDQPRERSQTDGIR